MGYPVPGLMNSYSTLLANWQDTAFVFFVTTLLFAFALGTRGIREVIEPPERSWFYRRLLFCFVAFVVVLGALMHADASRSIANGWAFGYAIVVMAALMEDSTDLRIRRKWMCIGVVYSLLGVLFLPFLVLGHWLGIAFLSQSAQVMLYSASTLIALLLIIDAFSGNLGVRFPLKRERKQSGKTTPEGGSHHQA